MGKSKKRDKFKYDESAYTEDEKITLLEDPINPLIKKETNSIKCPRGHFLSEKQWSTVRKTYFCVECMVEVRPSETSKYK